MTTSDEDYLRAADRLAREQGAIHEQWRNTALYIAGIVCFGFGLYLATQARLSANEQTQERWRACVQERGVEWCSDEAQARREANERAPPAANPLPRIQRSCTTSPASAVVRRSWSIVAHGSPVVTRTFANIQTP